MLKRRWSPRDAVVLLARPLYLGPFRFSLDPYSRRGAMTRLALAS